MKKTIFRLMISLIPVIPLYFLAKQILSNDVQIFWFLSYYYLIFVLLVTPFSKLLLKIKKLKKYSNKLINYRRPIWILAGAFSLMHVLHFEERVSNLWEKYYIEKMWYWDFLINSIFNAWWESIFWMNFYAFWIWIIGFIVMLTLLFTSNDLSQRIMWAKFWKYLQKGVYPLFIIVLLHIYFIWWWKGIYLYPWVILILLRSYTWFDERYERKWGKWLGKWEYRKFLCLPCWYIYDEELWDEDGWLAPWTKFEDIPNNWRCPVCWVSKKDFIPLDWHYNPEIKENHELEFILESKKYLTDDVVELVFLCKRDLEIKSWQFCNFIFRKWKNKIIRSYSVAKYIDNTLTFLIKLTEEGSWSAEIRKSKLWDQIKVLWPYWDFILKNTSRKKIFIATGTWLSPIYNMIINTWKTKKELHFWVRYEKDLFYLDVLKNIPNLQVFTYLSWEEIKGHKYGRVDVEKINIWKNDEVYICGNPKLVEQTSEALQQKQIENVYFEKFL